MITVNDVHIVLKKMYSEGKVKLLVSNRVVGILYGYSKQDIDFFNSHVSYKGYKYAYKKEGRLDDLSLFLRESGLAGEGFIPSFKDIDDINKGNVSYNNLIEGINSRRIIKSRFPINKSSTSKVDPLDKTKTVKTYVTRESNNNPINDSESSKRIRAKKREVKKEDLIKAFFIYKKYYGSDKLHKLKDEVISRVFDN